MTDIRKDHRKSGWDTGKIKRPMGGSTLTGNLCFPLQAWKDAEGMDENIEGHGGDDCAFGFRLDKAGYGGYYTERTIGYHIWHEPEPTFVQEHIKYIAKTYKGGGTEK